MKQKATLSVHSGVPLKEHWDKMSIQSYWRPNSNVYATGDTIQRMEGSRIVDLDEKNEAEDSADDIEVKREDSGSPNTALIRLQSRRDRRSNSAKRNGRPQPQIRQLSVLQRGNADPFNAAGITITPQVSQILAFARDICLPAFYFQDSLRDSSTSAQSSRDVTNSSGWISSPAARRGWQQVIDALADKCTALACLSTYLALMAACEISPTKATEASLKMRAGSSALLRQRLLQQTPSNSTLQSRQELLWQVFWLFYAEFFAGNMEAAQIHGRMLRQSCETAEEGVITPHFLDSVIFVDSNMSAKYMTRTVLDIEEWIPNVFAPIWEKIDPSVAYITKEDGDNLHPSIPLEPLRSIFTRTRQSLILLRQSSESHAIEVDYDTLFYWLNSHAYVDGGKVVDLYLQLVDKAIRAPKPKPEISHLSRPIPEGTDTSGYLHTQACLCLSALYSIRDIGQEITINRIDIVDASSTISKHLRESLVKSLIICTPAERQRYRAAHLFSAYIGALIEQRDADPASRSTSSDQDRTKTNQEDLLRRTVTVLESTTGAATPLAKDPSTQPFNSLLAELAHSLTLLTWQQVSDVLKQFIYTDSTEPHPSRWFWKTMGAYLDRRRRFQEQRQQAMQMPERKKGKEPEGARYSGGLKPSTAHFQRRSSSPPGPPSLIDRRDDGSKEMETGSSM